VGQKIKNTLCGVFYFYIQRKRRDLKPTVKKTVWWTVFREER